MEAVKPEASGGYSLRVTPSPASGTTRWPGVPIACTTTVANTGGHTLTGMAITAQPAGW
ncbi:hypothetical protein [Paeniglutamicibacter cryotolerans]|uniref:Uncharacterized protein n=1 Tax=Paeniglutamicibacter cryotolerans TaxID=670079 RepID=A0A839QPK8_9MICC|nr:hypothetical protein [Paeniglutamicibacter cryotolerans]MBB2995172.1 hypothetical protein [Paeniglutamicibacter cryotolerans]